MSNTTASLRQETARDRKIARMRQTIEALMAQLPRLLHQGGLQHIRQQTYRVPVGEAGGRVGKMLQQDILASLPGIKSFICKQVPVSHDHFDRLVEALPQEWKSYKTCYEYYLAYGQKLEGGKYE